MRTAGAGISIGDVLAGKYRVEKILGVGGMGVVVAVQHLRLEERFAIKLMLPEMLCSKEAVARFMREARASSTIKSEHVVRVFDVDSLNNGAPYMVMELLEGKDLATLLRERRPLGVEEAIDIILQVCEVAADAHARGIVHRDFKPSNLFATRAPDGRTLIKVLDFGISKITTTEQGGAPLDITGTAAAMGSPLYMSPEQMESARDVDFRTDIWSIGVILHELLAGRVPFEGTTPIEVGLKITGRPAPRLRAIRPDIPAVIENIVLKCLEKEPERRHRDVGELARALADFATARESLERSARRETRAAPAPLAAGVRSRLEDETSDATVTARAVGEMATPFPLPGLSKSVSSTATSPPAWGTTLPPRRRRRTGALVAIAATAATALAAMAIALRARDGAERDRADPTVSTTAEIEASSASSTATLEAPAAPLVAPAPVSIENNAALVAPASPMQDETPPARPPTAAMENNAPRASYETAKPPRVEVVKRPKAVSRPPPSVATATTAPAPSTSPPVAAPSTSSKPSVWQERK